MLVGRLKMTCPRDHCCSLMHEHCVSPGWDWQECESKVGLLPSYVPFGGHSKRSAGTSTPSILTLLNKKASLYGPHEVTGNLSVILVTCCQEALHEQSELWHSCNTVFYGYVSAINSLTKRKGSTV